MKKISMDVTAPKVSETWKLTISVEVPTSVEEWEKHLGKDALVQALERFTVIRAQDLVRRLKVGGKNHGPKSDGEIVSAVRGYKLGTRTVIGASVTPEAALSALKGLSASALMEAIKALQSAADEAVKEAEEA